MIGPYLSATRIGNERDPSDEARLHYGRLLTMCRSTLVGAQDATVALVYTLNRFSEIISLPNQCVLVHDQYVGQALNTLTRVVYWAEDDRASFRYFAKVLAEEYLLVGDSVGAATSYAIAASLEPYWTLPPIASSKRHFHEVVLQELFVFAHEFCHFLMSVNADFAASQMRIGDMLIEVFDDDADPQGTYSAYLKRYGNDMSLDELTRVANVQRAFVTDNRIALQEEMSCDDFAIHALITACGSIIDPETAFRAAFLCLRNIRFLNYVKSYVRQVRGGEPTGVDSRVRLLQAREHVLRKIVGMIAEHRKLAFDLDKTQSDLQTLSDEHDRKIDNRLLFEFLPGITEVRPRDHGDVHDREADVFGCFDIAERFGWRPRSAEVKYMLL